MTLWKDEKILYMFDAGDIDSRLPVARAAKAAGYDVTLALVGKTDAPPQGFKVEYIEVPDGPLNPRALLETIKKTRALIGKVQPDLLHAVTLKYAFIAGLADLAYPDTKKIYTLAGLGYLFRGEDSKARLTRAALSPFLKLILKRRDARLIFQNPDDMKLMLERGYADPARSALIPGSGVDLEKFVHVPEPQGETPLVLMPTRLVHEKGIAVFAAAAQLLKSRGVKARFQIAGGLTRHNPKAITLEEMKEIAKDGAVEWLGKAENMPALLSKAAIIVYPSYYGEGIPRVLLEACATGRPIVTTDHPGCREAVRHQENGLLVPVKDVDATAAAIEKLLNDAGLRAAMGARGRALAETAFDDRLIAAQTCALYKQALEKWRPKTKKTG